MLMVSNHLVAHRGWQRRFPENTLPAVAGALAAGARYVEVDLQLSADRAPVLFHDDTLERICRQPGAIHQYSYAELQRFSAYEPARFGERFLGTAIAHLRELVQLLQSHADAHLFLEIKTEALQPFGNAVVYDTVVPLLQPIAARCTLISFDNAFLQYAARRGWPALGPVLNSWAEIDGAALRALPPAVVFCDTQQLPAACDPRAMSFPLAVYEVDQPAQLQALLARGVRWVETFAIGELLEAGA
jgi:glycerophosphoryl diester phosphodiesterase